MLSIQPQFNFKKIYFVLLSISTIFLALAYTTKSPLVPRVTTARASLIVMVTSFICWQADNYFDNELRKKGEWEFEDPITSDVEDLLDFKQGAGLISVVSFILALFLALAGII